MIIKNTIDSLQILTNLSLSYIVYILTHHKMKKIANLQIAWIEENTCSKTFRERNKMSVLTAN
jgi:hypothetical protein